MRDKVHPSFNRNGYPTDETLQVIEKWEATDWPGLMDYLHEAWHDNGRFSLQNGHLELATGGWSGNEEILGALKKNRKFHALHFKSVERGGLAKYQRTENT